MEFVSFVCLELVINMPYRMTVLDSILDMVLRFITAVQD